MVTSGHKEGRKQLCAIRSNVLMMIIGILIMCDIHFDDEKSYADFGMEILELMETKGSQNYNNDLYQLIVCKEDNPIGLLDVEAAALAVRLLHGLKLSANH